MPTKSMGDISRLLKYSYLLRIAVLILIWGTVAHKYKLLGDISIKGFIVSALFFLSNIFAFIGFKTRTAMAILGATLLAHFFFDHDRSSLAMAAFTFAATLLPVGRYGSLDRYIASGKKITPYIPSPEDKSNQISLVWKIIFVIFSVNSIGGPTYNQILHHDTPYFLSWHMFHVKGRETVTVRFFHKEPSRETEADYLKALGIHIKRPEIWHNRDIPEMLIVGIPQLQSIIVRLCKVDPQPATLHLEARLATLQNGWYQLYDGKAPICAADGSAKLKTFPKIETGIPGSAMNMREDDSGD